MTTKQHTLLIGPPGSGRTLWTRDRPANTELSDRQRQIAKATFVLAGLALPMGHDHDSGAGPFRAPHHPVSVQAMTGSIRSDGTWVPGEIALAHGGVLFLDEAPEFSLRVLELVAYVAAMDPAPFQLILAANPCPCGWYGYATLASNQGCACTDEQIHRYKSRIPQTLYDTCEIRLAKPDGDDRAMERYDS